MNSETPLLQEIRLKVGGRPGTRLFRNNVAQAWIGRQLRPSGTMTVTVRPSDVVIFDARPLHAGLCKGSPDLVGWRSIVVTPAMVGRKIAAFLGIEAKAGRVPVTPEQTAFLEAATAAGALVGVARNVDDAARIADGL